MKINKSNATFSSIVGIGQKIKKYEFENDIKFLELNRGVNDVVGINLNEIMEMIPHNTKQFQVYAPNLGLESLRKSIVEEYFSYYKYDSYSFHNNIVITPGGMPSLDIALQILDVKKVYFPYFYWGSYSKMATIRNKEYDFYDGLSDGILERITKDDCIFICDPNNPTGIKYEDNYLIEKISELDKIGCTIIFDSPYRKLFYQDDFFNRLVRFENVIVTESFSKWIGLSGLRLGFIMCQNKEFNEELNIRMLYEFNGVASASQIIVDKILSTKAGKKAHKDFREMTVEHISHNINYLKQNGLLVESIYENTTPLGIFAIINKTEHYLFKNKIGAVGLDKFVSSNKEEWAKYSRICVSINNIQFKKYFDNIL
jgi:aspartate/methionine/tyrosine aminotransferase